MAIGALLAGFLPAQAQTLAGKTAAAAIATPKISYYHPDHLGSSSVLTNSSGAKIQQIAYLPYGEEKSALDSANFIPFHRFTGQIKDDETGLYFYNARYYDATLARFTQADSVVPDPENPQALNRYSYVYNNPLKYSDPTGHIPYLPGILQGLAQYNQNFFSSYFRPQIDWAAMPARPPSTAEKLSSTVPNYLAKGRTEKFTSPYALFENMGDSIGNWAVDTSREARTRWMIAPEYYSLMDKISYASGAFTEPVEDWVWDQLPKTPGEFAMEGAFLAAGHIRVISAPFRGLIRRMNEHKALVKIADKTMESPENRKAIKKMVENLEQGLVSGGIGSHPLEGFRETLYELRKRGHNAPRVAYRIIGDGVEQAIELWGICDKNNFDHMIRVLKGILN